MPTVFLAGGTGYTGRRFIANPGSLKLVALLRPGSASKPPVSPAILRTEACSANDPDALATAMKGCEAVVSFIGTTQAQFKSRGNYETVDYGTTVALVEAAKKVGIRHFVLLSSIGAGHPVGAYMKWKHRAEQYLIDSGLPYTIVRPSFITGPGRDLPAVMDFPWLAAEKIPGLSGLGSDMKRISGKHLAGCFVHILEQRNPLHAILTGRDLWRLPVDETKLKELPAE